MAVDSVTGSSGASYTQTQTPAVAKKTDDGLASKDTFMKLLVAQIRNQNPLNPQDGTQFVSQLAQFTTLEQSTQMRDDISAIRSSLAKLTAAASDPNTQG